MLLVYLSVVGIQSVSADDLVITPDRESGIYDAGETAGWTFTWEGETPSPPSHYEIKQGGLTILDEGRLQFSSGAARLEFKFSNPGAVRIETTWEDGDDEHRVIGGAVASPDDIGLSSRAPADFDAFWDANLVALAGVPVNAAVDWREDDGADWRYGVITMDHAAHVPLLLPGRRISGESPGVGR